MSLAAIRFGMGLRPGDPAGGDARGWLLDQLGPDEAAFDGSPGGMPGTSAAITAMMAEREARRVDPVGAKTHVQADMLRAEAAAAIGQAIDTAAPFRERLVWFWANHFTVSTKRGEVDALVGPYVREAIRPHVTGRFGDMLAAVMRHPAMLIYLDNANSAGPDSRAGRRQHAGLNENLGRESLELHTVTPASGYTQADVTSYAAILTGWSVRLKGDDPGFVFRPETHQPGDKTLMGQVFPEGQGGGEAALAFLARHPATYRALGTALARHFIDDAPPADAVGRIAARLRETDGDLGAAAAALVMEPAAWRPLTKVRAPIDYLVAVLRASDPAGFDRSHLFGVAANLGQPMWGAPLPNGWPDRAADWADSEGLLRRADWAFQIAGMMGDSDPEAVADAALGTLLRPATLAAMQHAGSRREALTLLFTAPEFMRR